MYLAELHGKLSPKVEKMEDILTSNVFSFFKYSRRDIFLKRYLNGLGFNISEQEAREATFLFWPRYEDNTEPDLVIIAGDYYLLIEAKYFSDFADETKETKAQLLREVEGGRREAENYKKKFYLVAITADSYKKEEKFEVLLPHLRTYCLWTNWQSVAKFLYNILENQENIRLEEREFALDLYNLLDKKNLRGFQTLDMPSKKNVCLKTYPLVFFDARTAKYRGDFIGFKDALLFNQRIIPSQVSLFFSSYKELFRFQLDDKRLSQRSIPIFYEES